MDKFLLLSESVRSSWQRIGKPARVLCAFSGGADSSALLVLLCRLRDAVPDSLRVIAAHVDHHLRPGSRQDAFAARALCEKLGVPFHLAHVYPVNASEDAARHARYEALYRIAEDQGCDAIALAHHMQDQSETLLLRLMRGSADGLKGMAEWTPGVRRAALWRPLLSADPASLRDLLTCCNLVWQEDETNADSAYLRNYVRHHVLPAMRKRASKLDAHILNTSQVLRDESDLLNSMASGFLNDHASLLLPCPFLDAQPFAQLHPALRRRVIRSMLAAFRLTDDVAFSHIDACAFISDRATVNLPRGFRLQHLGRRIHLLLPAVSPLPIESPEVLPYAPGLSNGIDYQSVPQALHGKTCLRYRQPGDHIRPFGMQGQKSLQDYLTDRKVDRPFRDHLPLLCIGSEVLWVIGVGASETLRASADPHRNILLHYTGRLIMQPAHHSTKEL